MALGVAVAAMQPDKSNKPDVPVDAQGANPGAAGEGSPQQRQEVFDEALSGLKSEDKIGDHKIKFVNKFAAAKLDANGNIIPRSTKTFDTRGEM